MKYSVLLIGGCGILLFAAPTMAKSNAEVQKIARSTSVEIKIAKSNEVGSGVLIRQQGDLYTLVTNRHVVCGAAQYKCTKPANDAAYTIITADGTKHDIKSAAVKLLPNGLDLSLVQFRSNKQYAIAKLADSSKLQT
jgi:S1-C subfamily serine protease